MNWLLNLFLFSLLVGACVKRSSVTETAADTTVTESGATAITDGNVGPIEVSESTTRTVYDSIYDHNEVGGIFNTISQAEGNAKLLFFGYLDYQEQNIKVGDVMTAVLGGPVSDGIMNFRTTTVTAIYDSINECVNFPLMEWQDQAKFMMSGIAFDKIKGMEFPDSFFEPGDSLRVELGGNAYLFYVTGTIKGETVRDYRLMLQYWIEKETNTVTLFSRAILPFPNTTDIVPEFIYWAGDLNNDNFIDVIAGSGIKSCATIDLWMAGPGMTFLKKATFNGCGC
jgi:hypothetical protein